MKKGISVMLAMMLSLGLAGCAETPEESVVVQKDQEQLIATANSLTDGSLTIAEQVQAPETVQESFTGSSGALTVNVDAEVVLPEGDTAGIIRVTGHDFTQEEVDGWTDTLFGDQTLYDPESFSQMTRSELEELLLEYQQKLAVLEAENGEGAFSEFVVEVSEEAEEDDETVNTYVYTQADLLREEIASIQEQMENAPEERILTEVDNQLAVPTGGNSYQTDFCVLNEENTGLVRLYVNNYPGDQRMTYINRDSLDVSSVSYNYWTYEWMETYDEEGWSAYDELPEPELTQTEAEILGNVFVESLRLEGLELAGTEEVVASAPYNLLGEESFEDFKGWRLTYLRSVDGIPLTCTDEVSDSPENGEFWWYESLTLMVTDDGVTECEYVAPYEMGEVLSENSALMEFDSILEIFEKMSGICLDDWWTDEDATGVRESWDVTEIRFGYTRITETGGSYSGLLVPSWTFYGYRKYSYRSGEGTELVGQSLKVDLMTINAIDGSVIDRKEGY